MYPFTKLGEWFAEDLIKRVVSAVPCYIRVHIQQYPSIKMFRKDTIIKRRV